MAKNSLLSIHKDMLEAGRDTSGQTFVKSAMEAFAVGMLEKKNAEATMEKHMDNLGGIENISKLTEQQKKVVTDFLRTNRAEYVSLTKEYEKTKDPATKDKMDAIKYKFQNLNNQIETFVTNKKEYMHDYKEGNLMKGGTYAKDNLFYTSVYGDPNAIFTIGGDDASISFSANGETRKLEDFGGHTVRNFDSEKTADALFISAIDAKWGGGNFKKSTYSSKFVNDNRQVDKKDLQALLQTDLTGDERETSMLHQWTNGELSDEFYDGVDRENITEEDVNNLLNDKQRSLDLMGKYVGDVSEDLFNNSEESSEVIRKRERERVDMEYKQSQTAFNYSKIEENNKKKKIDGTIIKGGARVGGEKGSWKSEQDRNKHRGNIINNEEFIGTYGEWTPVTKDGKDGFVSNNPNIKGWQSKWEVMQLEAASAPDDRADDYGATGEALWKYVKPREEDFMSGLSVDEWIENEKKKYRPGLFTDHENGDASDFIMTPYDGTFGPGGQVTITSRKHPNQPPFHIEIDNDNAKDAQEQMVRYISFLKSDCGGGY